MRTSARIRVTTIAIAVVALFGGVAHHATSAENGEITVSFAAAAPESMGPAAGTSDTAATHDAMRGLAVVSGCALLMLGCIATLRRRHQRAGRTGPQAVVALRSPLHHSKTATPKSWSPRTSLGMLSVCRT